jgi:phosphoadenosine phosphosulfate reductase
VYSYGYDDETGGLLLNTSPMMFSKEPRPVYSRELDILGFDKYWQYDKNDVVPYMWSESNCYWYRGRLVAKVKGGGVYTAPILDFLEKPEPDGSKLQYVDIPAMVAKNRELLTVIEQSTVKRIFDIYKRYKSRLDVFHVAFSGGKDSIVLLDLVKKALPRNAFVVVFGDTGMEFPDTYETVEKTRLQCEVEGIAFYIAKSHLDTKKSWKAFGPPAQVLRWCCSVHKSTPQTLKLREILGKNDFIGMDYVGVRAHESLRRGEYEYENFGKKQRGQHSHNPILEWTSAEIWLYIYANNLEVNAAYTKGNSRAGCLFCPMSGGKSDWLRRACYEKEVDEYIALIKESNGRDAGKIKDLDSHITNGGWIARKNGRDLKDNTVRLVETFDNGLLKISVTAPLSDWRVWMKTLGDFISDDRGYHVQFDGEEISFQVTDIPDINGYVIVVKERKDLPLFSKLFKQVFRKAAHCINCGVCEANCRNGCISFVGGLKITGCIHCQACHDIDDGCLAFHSVRQPQGEGKQKMSINSFADHAPKPEWLRDFFKSPETFLAEHTLGPMMISMFRRFLRDAGMLDKIGREESPSRLAFQSKRFGWESATVNGVMLLNLVRSNPQIAWYVEKLNVEIEYPRKTVEQLLAADGVSEKDAKSIVKAFKRLVETSLGTNLRFGYVSGNGDKIETLSRTQCVVTEPLVVLYGLFKFSEACGDYRQFNLGRLLDFTVNSNGISPAQVFGIERDRLREMLEGLAANHPDFITVSFTHDLEKISLSENQSSANVLTLIFGEK